MTLNETVKDIWNRTRRNLAIAGTGLAVLAATGLGSPQTEKYPHGTVYDITGAPLPGAVVTLLDVGKDTTGVDGVYDFQAPTSSVPDPIGEPQDDVRYVRVKDKEGSGCQGPRYRMAPVDRDGNEIKPKALDAQTYFPNMLTFEKNGHWLAQADVTDSLGTFQFNATLPGNVGTKYGQSTLPAQFGAIWYVMPTSSRLIPHRTEDLPMPVDGDWDSPSDSVLVQASIGRLNAVTQELMGKDWLVYAKGNGHPTRGPPEHQGIYIYHNNNTNQGQPVANDAQNPEYLIGGNVYLMNSNFIQSDGRSLDHELIYRLLNYNTYDWDNGIFRTSPQVITDFNREHQYLLRTVIMRDEEGKNNLIAFDYVRQFF